MKKWTPEAAMQDALSKHPECTYVDWAPGLNICLQVTIVVQLWRNKECYLADDPPRHTIEGYIRA